MKQCISNYLKKIAALIETDDTPTDPEIKRRRRLRVRQTPPGEQPRVKTKVQEEAIDIHLPPKIKPPRALPEHKKEWSEDTKTEKMKEYMQDYRSEGKVYETTSPKSKYIKKPKPE
jgi:hypothetical protein